MALLGTSRLTRSCRLGSVGSAVHVKPLSTWAAINAKQLSPVLDGLALRLAPHVLPTPFNVVPTYFRTHTVKLWNDDNVNLEYAPQLWSAVDQALVDIGPLPFKFWDTPIPLGGGLQAPSMSTVLRCASDKAAQMNRRGIEGQAGMQDFLSHCLFAPVNTILSMLYSEAVYWHATGMGASMPGMELVVHDLGPRECRRSTTAPKPDYPEALPVNPCIPEIFHEVQTNRRAFRAVRPLSSVVVMEINTSTALRPRDLRNLVTQVKNGELVFTPRGTVEKGNAGICPKKRPKACLLVDEIYNELFFRQATYAILTNLESSLLVQRTPAIPSPDEDEPTATLLFSDVIKHGSTRWHKYLCSSPLPLMLGISILAAQKHGYSPHISV